MFFLTERGVRLYGNQAWTLTTYSDPPHRRVMEGSWCFGALGFPVRFGIWCFRLLGFGFRPSGLGVLDLGALSESSERLWARPIKRFGTENCNCRCSFEDPETANPKSEPLSYK